MIDQAYRKINAALDKAVYREISEFHAKTNNFFLSSAASEGALCTKDKQALIQEMEYADIPLGPFDAQRVYIADPELSKAFPLRHKSAGTFTESCIPLTNLFSLLQHAFGNFRTAHQKILRPYPSGGALYSVQVIVGLRAARLLPCSPGYPEMQSGFYHYRPGLNALDFLKPMADTEMVAVLLNEQQALKAFNFCLIYVSLLAKAVFKYNYRGYRLSLLEAGSMYQQASLCGSQLALSDRVWSYFEDNRLCKEIGLHPVSCLPLIVQFFGCADV